MNETTKTAPSIMDVLVDALVERIKDKLIEAVDARIADNRAAIEADDIDGLEQWFKGAIDEHDRNKCIYVDQVEGFEHAIEKMFSDGDIKVSADNIDDLDDAIKDIMKQASVSLDFSF